MYYASFVLLLLPFMNFLNNMSIHTKPNLSFFLTLGFTTNIRYIVTFVVNLIEFVENDEKFNINLRLLTQRRKLRLATEAICSYL